MHHVARLPGRRQPARAPRAARRALAMAAAGVAAAVLVAACHRDASQTAATTTTAASAPLLGIGDSPISVPPTLPLPPGYELADTRGVELRPASGRPPVGPPLEPVPMTGGSARLTGIARGPDGPVPGATVRLERFVEDRVGRLDALTAADGSFTVRGLPGGRYRVRAWLRPFLTVTESAVTFVAAANGEAAVDLALERHNAMTVRGSVGARGWQVGQQTGVSVLITQEYVDADGIARTGGVSGTLVTLGVPAGLALVSDAAAVTGNDGYARFGIECTVPGQHNLAADTGGGVVTPIQVPTCVPPPPPTTQPPPPGPEVGGAVPVPGAGPFAPGTYTAMGINAARCATTYELQAPTGEWQPATGGAAIQATGFIRSLSPVPGAEPCIYRRTA